jgi:hypothetical protein
MRRATKPQGFENGMFTTGILADIWNVVDFGIEESLDLIQSKLGAQSISLRVTSSRVSQLRVGEFEGPRIFRSDGGYFFQPDKSKYANTRIKPVVASWLKSRDPLEKIVVACKKRDIELRLRISTLESPVIATRYPEAASKTIFGDVAPETLAAANSDVVELLRATVIDLSNRFAPSAIELDDPRFHSGAGYDHEFDTSDGFYSLMRLSFDESSAQSAIARGVDVEALTRWGQVAMEKEINGGESLGDAFDELMAKFPLLEAYVDSQIEDVTQLVTQLAGSAICPVAIVFGAFMDEGNIPRIDDEVFAHDRSAIVESFICTEEECEILEGFVAVKDLKASSIAHEIPMGCIAPDNPQRLVAEVRRLAVSGYGGAILSSFGLICPTFYESIKQAFRYASRDGR